jgi:phage tail-like protein
MADGDAKTEPIKYWKVQADGLQDLGMFYQCSLPSMTLSTDTFKVWDAQSKPDPLPVGVQASFGDVSLSRGVDKQGLLYGWISKVAQKGASADTVKDVTLLACDSEGNPVQTWLLKAAFPSSYSASGLAAGGSDVLTEQISLTYMEAQLDGKGGLTGGLDS